VIGFDVLWRMAICTVDLRADAVLFSRCSPRPFVFVILGNFAVWSDWDGI